MTEIGIAIGTISAGTGTTIGSSFFGTATEITIAVEIGIMTEIATEIMIVAKNAGMRIGPLRGGLSLSTMPERQAQLERLLPERAHRAARRL